MGMTKRCKMKKGGMTAFHKSQKSEPEVGNWPKKSSALALEIVSLKCNALVIMH